jgi:amino acid transporter
MLGAIAVQLLRIIEESKRPAKKRPDYKSIGYYVTVVASIVIAVIVGVIYFDGEPISHNRIVYFHTGASSPFLIRSLSNTLPAIISPKPKKVKS